MGNPEPIQMERPLTFIESALLLLKEEPEILASPEDAAYFRMKRAKAAPPLPLPPAPPIKSVPPPMPKIEMSPPPAKLPEPSQPQEQEPILEPKPREAGKQPISQMRSILMKVAPELAILDSIPDDQAAKQIANRWKTKNQSAPISILSSGELPQHKALLDEIAIALDVQFGPARLIVADPIEKEKQWKTFLSVGSLKLIVICDSTLWQLQHLRQFYKEIPADGTRTLGDVPIFLLPDLSLYLKDPLLKRSLWKALCTRLS
jgi:hypothetical protein